MPASQQTNIVSGYYCFYARKASQLLQQKQSFPGSKRDASEVKKLRIKMGSKCLNFFPDESHVQNPRWTNDAYSSPRIFCCTWAFYCIGKAHLIDILLTVNPFAGPAKNICAEFGIYATLCLEKENCCKILLRCLFVSHILRRQTWKSYT